MSELNFDSVSTNLPVKWVLDLLERGEERNLQTKIRELCLIDWREPTVLHGSDQPVLLQSLPQWLVLCKSANAASKIALQSVRDKEGIFQVDQFCRRLFHLLPV